MEKRGAFPVGVRLSKKLVRWPEHIVLDWMKSLGTMVAEAKAQAKVKINDKKGLIKAETTAFRLSETLEVFLKNDLIQSWADTYPKEFLTEEMKKARNWILCNMHKAPKSQWGKFFNSWFARGWDQYRKTLRSNEVKPSREELIAMLKKG